MSRTPQADQTAIGVKDLHKPDYAGGLVLGRAKILLVDDHEIGQEFIGMMVSRLGMASEKAKNGHDAVKMVFAARALKQPYALVLMDFLMPTVDGVESTRRIRSRGVTPLELPIIALTGCASADEIMRFRDAGGQGHLHKPVSLEDLQAVFEAWLPQVASVPVGGRTAQEEALFARYRIRKATTLKRIQTAVAAQDRTVETVAEILEMLHNLAGTAGLFGEDRVSIIAREVELGLLTAKDDEVQDLLATYEGRLSNAL